MPNRALIHVGLPKCGSTALQARLQGSHARLLEHGILYPLSSDVWTSRSGRSYRAPGHMRLANELATLSREGAHASPTLADYLAQYAAAGAHTLVLSSESLAGRLGRVAPRLLAPLQQFEVEVLLLYRRADTLALSAYNQSVRARRNTQDLAAFLARPDKPGTVYPNIVEMLDGIRRLFPAARFHVHDLDATSSADSVAQIEALLGLPLTTWPSGELPSLLTGGGTVNGSLSPAKTLYLLACNRSDLADDRVAAIWEALAEVPDDPPDGRRLMTRRESRRLLARFAADNAALPERYGVPLAPHVPDRSLPRREPWTTLGPGERDAITARIAPLLPAETLDALHAALG